jgi:hypothetical protein
MHGLMHGQREESPVEAAPIMSMDVASSSKAVRHRYAERVRRLTTASGGDSRQRSRVGNGNALLMEGDGRGAWCRRLKSQIIAHCNWRGGEAACSSAELSLIRRAACMEVELERMECAFAKAGEASPSEIDLYARTAGNLRRLFETLNAGLAARPRDIGGDYLDQALAEELGKQ